MFPHWWHRGGVSADKNTTHIYHIRCPPLYNWLRVMAAGPLGYNPRDPSALRSYPHFTFDRELEMEEARSRYRLPRAFPHERWTEGEMLEVMQSDKHCLWCDSGSL